MVANAKKTVYEYPICSGRGRVPGRTRLCPECHGTGRTTPIRREALLKRMKTRARAEAYVQGCLGVSVPIH
jgi:DnaJ-class molecular chaperone